jgi:hypothetical protein
VEGIPRILYGDSGWHDKTSDSNFKLLFSFKELKSSFAVENIKDLRIFGKPQKASIICLRVVYLHHVLELTIHKPLFNWKYTCNLMRIVLGMFPSFRFLFWPANNLPVLPVCPKIWNSCTSSSKKKEKKSSTLIVD